MPAQPSATRPRASWLAGVGVVAASAAAGAVTLLVFGGNLLTVLAVTCITAGVLSLGFALAVRTRRLPRPVLMLLLAPLVASGWLASVAAVPAATDSSTVQVHAVGESRTVDLRDIDTDVVETIRVTAVDAELEILLPGHVAHSDETLRWSTFSYVPDSPETPAIVPGGLHIDAVLSHITVVESP